MMTDELKRFLALWEQAVCEIRAENKVSNNNARIAYHVAIKDKVDEHREVYYHTLTQEE